MHQLRWMRMRIRHCHCLSRDDTESFSTTWLPERLAFFQNSFWCAVLVFPHVINVEFLYWNIQSALLVFQRSGNNDNGNDSVAATASARMGQLCNDFDWFQRWKASFKFSLWSGAILSDSDWIQHPVTISINLKNNFIFLHLVQDSTVSWSWSRRWLHVIINSKAKVRMRRWRCIDFDVT